MARQRRIARNYLIALSVLAGIVIPASSPLAASLKQSSGGIGIRLIDLPGPAPTNPLAHTYIADRVSPGTSIRRQVEISNTTHATTNVAVYTAAATLRQGRFGFADSRTKDELSGWASVSRPVLRMGAGTKTLETLTITVPKMASPGERYAVIWAEVSAPAKDGVKLVNRVGIRIYLSIGPGGAPAPKFVIGQLAATRSSTGQPLVVETVRNSGTNTIAVSGTLTLTNGPGGVRAGPFRATLGAALSPGESRPITIRLASQLPRGTWRAHLQLGSGLTQHAAFATLRFAGK
jgi:hypothetical protein